jgi:uncharacterized repeat protein (TIGR01451 family)
MKKVLTAMTAMSMTLQASEYSEKNLEITNPEVNETAQIHDILQNDDFSQSLLDSTSNKSKDTNLDTLGGSGSFMNVDKYVFIEDDVDLSGSITQGDILTYDIVLRGPSQVLASDVVVFDVLDTHTSLINGSVETINGTIIEGNGLGDVQLVVEFGDIPINIVRSVKFSAFVNSIPSGQTIEISNQAFVTTSDLGDFISDDPFTLEFGDPTVVTADGFLFIFNSGFE